MPAVKGQILVYRRIKAICKFLNIPQSTLVHRSLAGSLGTADPTTGNQVYTGPGAVTQEQNTPQTKLWVVWQPQESTRTRDSHQVAFRENVPVTQGMCPAIDDNRNQIIISHNDWITDGTQAGVRWLIYNPTISEDGAYWIFEMNRQR